MKISQLRQQERPREKLQSLGAQALSDSELLALLLRTGSQGTNVIELASHLLNTFGSLRGLLTANHQALCQINGMGPSKAVQLQATLELSRRFLAEQLKRENAFTDAKYTQDFLLAKLRDEPNEVFALLTLDSQHRLIQYHALFHGTIDGASVYPRVIAQQVLSDNAAAAIVAHNHPSGIAEPSKADEYVTRRIKDALALLDVILLDHIVVGDGETVSFAQRGLL